ncbi:MAG TPA: biotin/lipoyl-binding protein, partial [Vicinamibacterales bacterium]
MLTDMFNGIRAQRLLVLAVMATAAFSACARPAAQAAEPPPAQVTAAEVISRDLTEWDEFTGRLEAVESVEIRPRVTGYIESVNFTQGSIVKKGDLLFVIDPRPY